MNELIPRNPILPSDVAYPVALPARTARRVAALERQAPRLVHRATAAGVPIDYLGMANIFGDAKIFSGETTDWSLALEKRDVHAVVPARERKRLAQLVAAGIDFPLIYVAHEVPKGVLPVSEDGVVTSMDHSAAAAAIGEVPPPVWTVELGQRLGAAAQQIVHGLKATLPVLGAVAAAPFAVAGMALGALAGLDPIVFGVIPAGPAVEGQPAAWYVLARWDW